MPTLRECTGQEIHSLRTIIIASAYSLLHCVLVSISLILVWICESEACAGYLQISMIICQHSRRCERFGTSVLGGSIFDLSIQIIHFEEAYAAGVAVLMQGKDLLCPALFHLNSTLSVIRSKVVYFW